MKLKDFVTMGNLLGGFFSVIALFEIEDPWRAFEWSCYWIYIAYVFDVLDGPVARLTQEFDEFGGIFDSVCDFVSNSIAPAFIIYYFFVNIAGVHWMLATAIGGFPIVFGTIRQAKQQERQLSYPCYWIGLPRPVLTLFILALLNSGIFRFGIEMASPWREIVLAVAALLITGGSILHLSYLPFVNRTQRRWMKFLRFGLHAFLTVAPIVFLVGWLGFGVPEVVYDYLLFCLTVYIFVSWTQTPKEDFRRIKRYIETGERELPLVHRENDWKAKSLAVFFVETGPNGEIEK